MEILLDPLAAPTTVNSFVYLARWHYYDGIVFHRVIPGFVLQGGDPTGTGAGGPGYRFNDELPKPGRYDSARSRWPTPDPTPTVAVLHHLRPRRHSSPAAILPLWQGGEGS